MQDGMPSGIVLAKNPRTGSLDELKNYKDNTIYLNDGNEFQIRLFNPLREKIGVQIGLNGENSTSYLVLNPGEDVTIDRFIDTQKKMLFETYNYDSSNSAAQNAVAKNGIVTIKFFKEVKALITTTPFNSTGGYNQLYRTPGVYTNDVDLSAVISNSGTLNLHDANVFNTTSLSSTNNLKSGNLDMSTCTTANPVNATYTTTSMDNLVFNSDEEVKTKSYQPKSRMKETGRVGKGNSSTQNFKKVEVEFYSVPFHEIIYSLKPVSEKSEDIEIREFCTDCGYRIRNAKYNFCPKCGTKI